MASARAIKRRKQQEARLKAQERTLQPIKIIPDTHPLDSAYRQGKLFNRGFGEKEAFPDSATRYHHGSLYREWFREAHRPGRDSTLAMPSGGGGLPPAFGESSRKVISTDSNLSKRDRKIVRMVLGEGYSLHDAVEAACGAESAKRTVARFCEALDALIEAIDMARRHGYRVFNTQDVVRPLELLGK